MSLSTVVGITVVAYNIHVGGLWTKSRKTLRMEKQFSILKEVMKSRRVLIKNYNYSVLQFSQNKFKYVILRF